MAANRSVTTKIAVFERYAKVLHAVRTIPIASSKDIKEKALPDISFRTSQRYLKELMDAGYITRFGSGYDGYRYYPTTKAIDLFGDKRHVEQSEV